jgi:hypothetical protein
VTDSCSGDSFSLEVDGSSALDVFHHPYAYAAQRGVEFLPPVSEADMLVLERS